MKINSSLNSAFFKVRAVLAVALTALALLLGFFALAGVPSVLQRKVAEPPARMMPVPGGKEDDLNRLEQEWHDRISYPTGVFDPTWMRNAIEADQTIERQIPAGLRAADRAQGEDAPFALNPNAFTALGPQPARMTGCAGCFDYGLTAGRVNAIAMDPRTSTNGSITAYAATVGGGVYKTTNCCTNTSSWTALTDNPLISTTNVDAVEVDPNNPNTVYAGTGDLNFGSFSMGSQGILKSTDAGATWTVLGKEVFGALFPTPAGRYFQYQAVGKVRVDPNNSNIVIAGTKTGLYMSYDAGNTWTGPCTTNAHTSQRQDITGLELTNAGNGITRILAAVGVRGFATTVQYNLDQNGANGLYRGTVPANGCPSDFTLISRNDNGFNFGTQVPGSPYTTGQNMNAGSGTPYANTTTGTQLGRMDIAVAPSNPNYIYAQVSSIAPNSASGCGNAQGCQLGAWVSSDGGGSWSFITGSAGGSLASCTGAPGSGDYPQNWFDQAVTVDPNDPNRVFFSTFDVWFWQSGSPVWNNTSCGYSGGNVVHVDQHALAFAPGSSSILLAGNDGGVHGTNNANSATAATDPSWFNMTTGFNTIEFYSGDISGNFATSPNPQANGGTQDNGSYSVTFNGSPTGPVLWQMGRGGDGFYGRIDPVGTGTSLRFWQGNNNGALARCISNCTNPGASWSVRTGGWGPDTKSFILPYDLFHGGIPGGDDCPPASATGGCGRLIAGTTRVWETVTGAAATTTWYVTNNPATQNMTKQSLGNRSFITQIKYSPKFHSVAMLGTNDGNAWIGFNLGTGTANQANWVNVTGGNSVLPNRPIVGVALDPTVASASTPIGYAAVGGFDENTPDHPGHVYQVVCDTNCANPVWTNKSGNLPNMPVDSIIVNPNFPQQVFAGTDIGLYYTDDINAATPTWYRFNNGLPNVMIWDMQIDRGATTLSLWTRGKGAFVWPLPLGPVPVPTPTSVVSRKTHGSAGTFDVDLRAAAPAGVEPRSGGATGDHTVVISFASPVSVIGDGNAKAQVTSGRAQVGVNGVANGNAVTVNGNDVIVSLTNVANAQRVTISLFGVTEGTSSGSIAVPMAVLLGDTTNNSSVTSSDLGSVKANSGLPVDGSNFRNDITPNGSINSSDVGAVKSQAGTTIP